MSIPLGNIRSNNKLQSSTIATTDNILMRSNDGKDKQISYPDLLTKLETDITPASGEGIEIRMGDRTSTRSGSIRMGARV